MFDPQLKFSLIHHPHQFWPTHVCWWLPNEFRIKLITFAKTIFYFEPERIQYFNWKYFKSEKAERHYRATRKKGFSGFLFQYFNDLILRERERHKQYKYKPEHLQRCRSWCPGKRCRGPNPRPLPLSSGRWPNWRKDILSKSVL